MKSKKRRYQLTPRRTLKLRSTATTFGLVLLLALVTFALLTAACYNQYTLTGPYAREYEGKILDKSQTITDVAGRKPRGGNSTLTCEGAREETFA